MSLHSLPSLWICYKKLHLELIKDLSRVDFSTVSSAFYAPGGSLNKFGQTTPLRHNTTLLELKRLLSNDHQKSVHDFCLSETIDGHFIPPRSPNFGGLWKAVKPAKHHFYRAVGPSVVAFDELRTLDCHISAVINSGRLVLLLGNWMLLPQHISSRAVLLLPSKVLKWQVSTTTARMHGSTYPICGKSSGLSGWKSI